MKGINLEGLQNIIVRLEKNHTNLMQKTFNVQKQMNQIDSSFNSIELEFLTSNLKKSIIDLKNCENNILNEINVLKKTLLGYQTQDLELSHSINAMTPNIEKGEN